MSRTHVYIGGRNRLLSRKKRKILLPHLCPTTHWTTVHLVFSGHRVPFTFTALIPVTDHPLSPFFVKGSTYYGYDPLSLATMDVSCPKGSLGHLPHSSFSVCGLLLHFFHGRIHHKRLIRIHALMLSLLCLSKVSMTLNYIKSEVLRPEHVEQVLFFHRPVCGHFKCFISRILYHSLSVLNVWQSFHSFSTVCW